MWIELPDEIEEYLSNINSAMNKSSLAINALFESMLKGQHIVFATRKLLSRIAELEYINPSNRDFICWIKQKYIYVYGCKDVVEYKIRVISQQNTIRIIDKTYEVPLEYFYDFRESKLLTENETDGVFFLDIYNFVRAQKRVSNFFNVKFENDSCHGANVASKILQNAKEDRIAVCILDSDREMKDAKLGDTYKGANNSFNRIKNNHIMLLKALGVREKENLFPPAAYMLVCDENQILLKVLNHFAKEENVIKYFDIKDGVKLKKYQIAGWKQYYSEVIEELIREGGYKLPEIVDGCNPEFICIEGIGDKICDVVCKVLLEDENVCKKVLKERGIPEEKRKSIMETRKTIPQLLPEYIYDEWEQIHNLLFSWGCCISEKRLPNYQM